MGKEKIHPCLNCGACCASFRVQFYWREAEASNVDWQVPKDYVQDLDDQSRCMQGTNKNHNIKCKALIGKIGENASCSIYENRPSPCRKFQASYENNEHNPRCDLARAKHGLKALCKTDWLEYRKEQLNQTKEEML